MTHPEAGAGLSAAIQVLHLEAQAVGLQVTTLELAAIPAPPPAPPKRRGGLKYRPDMGPQ